MNKVKMSMLILLSIIVQTAIIPNFGIFGAYANITLAFTIAVAMNFGSYFGGYLGLGLGFLEDLLFSEVIGVKALIFFVIGFVVGYNEDMINKEDLRTGSFVTAICTFVYWLLNAVIFRILGNTFILKLRLSTLIEMVLNILLYLMCHYLLKIVLKKKKFKF